MFVGNVIQVDKGEIRTLLELGDRIPPPGLVDMCDLRCIEDVADDVPGGEIRDDDEDYDRTPAARTRTASIVSIGTPRVAASCGICARTGVRGPLVQPRAELAATFSRRANDRVDQPRVASSPRSHTAKVESDSRPPIGGSLPPGIAVSPLRISLAAAITLLVVIVQWSTFLPRVGTILKCNKFP
jgi:hypothetical protein